VTAREEVRRAGRIAGFGAVTATMLPLFVARRAAAPGEAAKEEIRERWIRAWASALLRVFAVRVRVDGAVRPAGRGQLVVANHRSTIDIAALLRTFGGYMVSRADLSQWPLVGAAARSVGTVFVDRQDRGSGAGAVRAMRRLLQAGRTVIVFPEGTTFPDDELRPFLPGAFLAAAHTGASVVPVGIAYAKGSGAAFVAESFPAHLSRMSKAPPTDVVLRVGSPLAAGGKAADMRDRAHVAVSQLIGEARAIVDSL
jgi:1-acyl-sn-glycerol-3-phosphate acyltransferase